MKATELMIWDWVFVAEYDEYTPAPHNTPYPVQILHGADIDKADEISFEPIPLTPEILEKNGWKEAQFWHEYKDGKNTIQACLPDMRGIINGVEFQHFKCEYVHQYQHLLRDCKFKEMADNFKI